MKPLTQGSYSAAQVLSTLLAQTGSRIDAVRYELRDSTGQFIRSIDSFVSNSCSIEHHAYDDIKDTFRGTLQEVPLELTSYSATILPDAPELFLRLAETSGTTAQDSSGNGHTGTYNGTAGTHYSLARASLLTDEASDLAVAFLGSSSGFVSVPNHTNFNSSKFAWSCIVNTTAVSTGTILSRDNGSTQRRMALVMNADGTVTLTMFWSDATSNTYTSVAKINDGRNHHLRLLYDQTKLTLYADYAVLITTAITKTPRSVTQQIEIGKSFNGTIDEVVLFTSSITAAQARLHYQTAVQDASQINYASDRLRVYYGFYMPDGGLVEWACGVFLLTTPARELSEDGITYSIEGYSKEVILIDSAFIDRYTISSGTNYITAIATILSDAGIITSTNLTASSKTLPVTLDFELGTTRLDAINQLLAAINYDDLYFDENGMATAQPHKLLVNKSVDFTYYIKPNSVLYNEQSIALTHRSYIDDYWKVPNQIVLYSGSTDGTNFRSVATNYSLSSKASVPNRGGRIIVYKEQIDAADQTTQDTSAQRRLEELSQVCTESEFPTLVNPLHGHLDLIQIVDETMNVSGKFLETGWTMQLQAGGEMIHTLSACEMVS